MSRSAPREPAASGSWASIRAIAARATRNWLVAFVAMTVSQPSSVASWSGPSPIRRPLMPATLYTASSRPSRRVEGAERGLDLVLAPEVRRVPRRIGRRPPRPRRPVSRGGRPCARREHGAALGRDRASRRGRHPGRAGDEDGCGPRTGRAARPLSPSRDDLRGERLEQRAVGEQLRAQERRIDVARHRRPRPRRARPPCRPPGPSPCTSPSSARRRGRRGSRRSSARPRAARRRRAAAGTGRGSRTPRRPRRTATPCRRPRRGPRSARRTARSRRRTARPPSTSSRVRR